MIFPADSNELRRTGPLKCDARETRRYLGYIFRVERTAQPGEDRWPRKQDREVFGRIDGRRRDVEALADERRRCARHGFCYAKAKLLRLLLRKSQTTTTGDKWLI